MRLHPRFKRVGEVFAALFSEDLERGAGFSALHRGEVVVDLHQGFSDRARTRRFGSDTLVPVFSVTKLLAAVLLARLVDAGGLAYEDFAADLWPEFGAAGKARIDIAMLLSHQGGLCGFPDPMDPADWLEVDLIRGRLAAMAPLWAPGTSGYHPLTIGYILGELFERIDGRSMGRALAEDLAEPFGLDLHMGASAEDEGRLAELDRPKELPRFGPANPALRAAFLSPWSSPPRGPAWRRLEVPSATGCATSLSLARLLAATIDPKGGVLSPKALAAMTVARVRGRDLVLPYTIAWGAGVMRNQGLRVYGPDDDAFGHSGWGGSCAAADPGRSLAFAYVTSRQSSELVGDRRAMRLVEALYACL